MTDNVLITFRFIIVLALTQNNKDKADIALDDTEMNKNLYGEFNTHNITVSLGQLHVSMSQTMTEIVFTENDKTRT